MNKKLRSPMNKKGVLGLTTVRDVMILFLIIAVIGISIILALVSLRDAGIFGTGTLERNQTDNIVANISTATADFFTNTSTIFSILVVVVIILAIAIIIAVVTRFGGGARATTSL